MRHLQTSGGWGEVSVLTYVLEAQMEAFSPSLWQEAVSAYISLEELSCTSYNRKKVYERRGEDSLNYFTLFLLYFHHALSCQHGCVQWHTWRDPWIWKRSQKEMRCLGRPWPGSTVPLRKNQKNSSWWVLLSWNWNWMLLQAELNLLHLQQTRWWTCGDDWWVRGRNKSSCRPCTRSSPSSFPSVYPPPAPWFDWNSHRRKHSELLYFNITKNRPAKTTNCAFKY